MSAATGPEPRRLLVLSLGRLGDLIQMGPPIAGLRARFPGATVTVAAERSFASVCQMVPGVDEVLTVDFDRLAGLLLGGGHGVAMALRAVEDAVRDWRERSFDAVLNLGASHLSAILTFLLRAPVLGGWTITPGRRRVVVGPWARLGTAATLNHRYGPFNVVDYHRRLAGGPPGRVPVRYEVPRPARDVASRWLSENGRMAGRPLVAFQLGASRPGRRWPAEYFAAVGTRVIGRLGAQLLILGGERECEGAATVSAAVGRDALDATGKTTVGDLAALLAEADLLLAPDTGPMHLAAAVGTPVVGMFFGPALPHDTGPYAEGHVVVHADVACAPCAHTVTCLDPFCRTELSPEVLAEAVVARLAGDERRLASLAGGSGALRWYRTGFDGRGCYVATPLGHHPQPGPDRVRNAYRALWSRGARVDGGGDARVAVAFAHLAELAAAAACSDLGRQAIPQSLIEHGAAHPAASLLVDLHRLDWEEAVRDAPQLDVAVSHRLWERLRRRAHRLATLLGGLPENHLLSGATGTAVAR